jgi:hypothetical protein
MSTIQFLFLSTSLTNIQRCMQNFGILPLLDSDNLDKT